MVGSAMRQQSDIKVTSRGPDLTIRFHTKRAKTLVERAARLAGLSMNRWAVSVMYDTAVEQLGRSDNGDASK